MSDNAAPAQPWHMRCNGFDPIAELARARHDEGVVRRHRVRRARAQAGAWPGAMPLRSSQWLGELVGLQAVLIASGAIAVLSGLLVPALTMSSTEQTNEFA